MLRKNFRAKLPREAEKRSGTSRTTNWRQQKNERKRRHKMARKISGWVIRSNNFRFSGEEKIIWWKRKYLLQYSSGIYQLRPNIYCMLRISIHWIFFQNNGGSQVTAHVFTVDTIQQNTWGLTCPSFSFNHKSHSLPMRPWPLVITVQHLSTLRTIAWIKLRHLISILSLRETTGLDADLCKILSLQRIILARDVWTNPVCLSPSLSRLASHQQVSDLAELFSV